MGRSLVGEQTVDTKLVRRDPHPSRASITNIAASDVACRPCQEWRFPAMACSVSKGMGVLMAMAISNFQVTCKARQPVLPQYAR